MKPRINKDGSPDKRFNANKEHVQLRETFNVEENLKTPEKKLIEAIFKDQYDYEFISYEDLEIKVVNMGDYLLMLPQTTERFIKIKVKDV